MAGDSITLWPDATTRLRADPDFAALVARVGPVRLRGPRGDVFQALAAAIIFQQLAGRAARTIHDRFGHALDGEVSAARVMAASDDVLRSAGLSANKLAAIRDLAYRVAHGHLPLDDLADLPDADVVARLTTVRGIGEWTAHMFLIFELQRPDVWPVGDLGVRTGLARVLRLAAPPAPREMEWIGYGYRPWRSAVAWYCWRAMETPTPG
jgi:DNA-3-methyladenine glycosylase II